MTGKLYEAASRCSTFEDLVNLIVSNRDENLAWEEMPFSEELKTLLPEVLKLASETDAEEGSDVRIWLNVPLSLERPPGGAALAGATFIALCLYQRAKLTPALGTRWKPASDTTRGSIEDQINQVLNNNQGLSFQGDVEHWLSLRLDADDVLLKAGKSPTRILSSYYLEFRRGGHILVTVRAQEGMVRLTPQDFKAALGRNADCMVIVTE